ncbi:MAG TPA: tetratricopeptide repeat protein [Longimicrobiales bacterium]|nr:tetratricopeptide repeat protein [Longimicrobiales bacterium]
MRRKRISGFAVVIAALTGACSDNETVVARGDRLWADSNFVGARAEYRLAVAQRGDDDALARLAHAYSRTGELEPAREAYEALVAREPRYAAQAAADYLHLARRARARSDEYGLARAVEAALAVRPGIRLPEFELPLARYYRGRGDAERAREHYRRALLVLPGDSAPRLLYEMGLLEESQGDCRRAIELLDGARAQARRSGSSEGGGPYRQMMTESRWHLGNCSFQLAQDARGAGRVTEALELFERMIGLGEPENLLDQAWFDRGETLYGIGRFDEALVAYRQVLERNPTRAGQLVERARRRIDDIRFSTPAGDADRAIP